MIDRLFRARGSALALALFAGSPAFAGTTAAVSVANGAYTDLGVGPAKISNSSVNPALICEGDSLPSAGSVCHVLPGGQIWDFGTASHLYGQSLQPGQSINLVASPLQVSGGGGGGAVTQSGAWSVGLTGTLPAFAATPTFNLGTLNGAATTALQSATITALGSPAQDGTDATGVTQLSGGVGIRGWLSGIYAKLAGTLAISATSLPLPTGAATATLQSAAQSAPGTPQTVALTVQGNASGVAVPTTETYANLATAQVSVAATATLIVAARAGRKEVTIINHGTTDLYLGSSSGVTTSTGQLLAGVKGEGVTYSGGAAIYGIAASGSQTVSVAEVY
jgi:hypothetical protein